MANQVKFVICERLHENGDVENSLLVRYNLGDKTFVFADGDPDCFDPENILMFDNYDSAKTIVDMAWDINQTYLGVVIWESDYPNEVDYTYVNSGKEKNMIVKRNREAE